MSVADRIAVMNKGQVEQFDTPVAIYDRPQTLFVNGFIGTTNLMNGKVASVRNGTATVALDAGASLSLSAPAGVGVGAPVLMSVRPEQLALSSVPGPDAWKIVPGLSLPIGAQLVHEARTADGASLKIVEPRRAAPADTARIYCTLAADARPTLFPRST
jgi:putative spermidine/putrescine transport system ATP-binding protein